MLAPSGSWWCVRLRLVAAAAAPSALGIRSASRWSRRVSSAVGVRPRCASRRITQVAIARRSIIIVEDRLRLGRLGSYRDQPGAGSVRDKGKLIARDHLAQLSEDALMLDRLGERGGVSDAQAPLRAWDYCRRHGTAAHSGFVFFHGPFLHWKISKYTIGFGVRSRSLAGVNSRSYFRPWLGKSSSGTKRSGAPRCSIRRYLPLGDGRGSAMDSHPNGRARPVVDEGLPALRIISNRHRLDVLNGVR